MHFVRDLQQKRLCDPDMPGMKTVGTVWLRKNQNRLRPLLSALVMKGGLLYSKRQRPRWRREEGAEFRCLS